MKVWGFGFLNTQWKAIDPPFNSIFFFGSSQTLTHKRCHEDLWCCWSGRAWLEPFLKLVLTWRQGLGWAGFKFKLTLESVPYKRRVWITKRIFSRIVAGLQHMRNTSHQRSWREPEEIYSHKFELGYAPRTREPMGPATNASTMCRCNSDETRSFCVDGLKRYVRLAPKTGYLNWQCR